MRGEKPQGGIKRPFVGMHFKCCKVYTRLYLNKACNAFVGWCPKCARKAEVRISPDGCPDNIFQSD